MAVTINKVETPTGKPYQHIYITVNADGEDCKFTHSAPSDLSGDGLQDYVDMKEDFYKRELLRNMYGGADAYDSSLEDFEAWVSDGATNAEVTKEMPAIEARDAVYEDVEVTPAIEAVDAVMGERAITETVETGSYINLAGETITETSEQNVTEEVTETVVERQTGEDGITREVEVERTTQVPVMEAYEIEPAIESVDAVIEQRLVSPAVEAKDAEQIIVNLERVIEKKTWVDSH